MGILTPLLLAMAVVPAPPASAPPGQMDIIGPEGKPIGVCPLERTSVHAHVQGLGSRVTVVQTFLNPSREPIEAVYTFPLPADAAVDRMRINVAGRVIEGEIKRREEARAVYDRARAAGQVAALLDQERPNVFTQNVANIMPGARIEVEISYLGPVKFEDGAFEFVFPMVVGPRFIPASVPDPAQVSPPVTPEGTRTGTDIDLSVSLDAGAPIERLESVLHAIQVERDGDEKAVVRLSRKDEIPNRDFVLRYWVKGAGVTTSFTAVAEEPGWGTFQLVFVPPAATPTDLVRDKEVIFVMDQSGSQQGFPLEKSKELTLKLIPTLGQGDTFNVVAFANGVVSLWPEPRSASPANVREAESFVRRLAADGGTMLLGGVEAALKQPPKGDRVRLVVFNTDGFVGNEFEVLQAVQKYRLHGRMFTFGIGNGVNRFLIDAMSAEGRGDSEIVTLAESADAAVARFIQRTQNPVLTDIRVTFDGGGVALVTPQEIPDVFSDSPVIVYGRFTRPGPATVTVRGMIGGRPYEERLSVEFPREASTDQTVPTLWARRRIDDLTREDWMAQASGVENPGRDANGVRAAVTELGLRYRLVTQYTSFVAVERRVVNVGGRQRTVNVPVEMTDGVSYDGVFGGGLRAPGSPLTRSASAQLSGDGGAGGGGSVPARDEQPSVQVTGDPFVDKVAKRLRDLTEGRAEVQVWLSELSDEVVEMLKAAGLTVDDRDPGLKLVFGTIDVAKLRELAKVEAVKAVEPLD